ncbi:MAG: T9SS type A sorting domain-containing protein, partial [Candidatus Cloacimonetes bacterium]|nr:T9SS type A sorting domain-containing protein [Candidatus Cloacimonadota bacterium]
QVYNWGYSDPDNPQVHVLQPDGDSAQTLFTSENPAQPLGILNQTNTYTTIASSFELSKVQGGTPHDELYTLLAIILDKFGLISFIPVEAEDAQIPAAELRGHGFPNPFTSGIYIDIELPKAAQVKLDIYNLRGQKVRSLAQSALPAGNQQFFWDGRDQNQIPSAPGIYFWRLNAAENRLQGKILKLSN